jgi:hypothetical protein
VQPFTGLPELRLDGLADGDARTLLAAGVHAPIDDVVRERVVARRAATPWPSWSCRGAHSRPGSPGGSSCPMR